MIADQESRDRALDPARSFIVQAPAGSGKTDLLVKRYIKLLGVVDKPEEILAITFTIRAAAEMKSRDLLRSEEHTSELQSQSNLVCRLLLEKKKKNKK